MNDEIALSDKVTVIVGGVPEVAEATARVLATRGAAGLMICGRGAERGQALAAIISAAGCPTHFLPVDLARPQDCAAVVTEAELVFGRIDLLVVGAGEVPYLPLEDTTPEKLDQLLAAKVRAPFLVLQGATALMQRTGVDGTVIVTIGGTGAEGPRRACGDGAGLCGIARGPPYPRVWPGPRRRAERHGGDAPCSGARDRRPCHGSIASDPWLDHLRAGHPRAVARQLTSHDARPDRRSQAGAARSGRPSMNTVSIRPARSATTRSAAAPGTSRPRSWSPR